MPDVITGPIRILLVEDNAGDRRLIEEAFADAGLGNDLRVVETGEQAMEALLQKPGRPPADLVLLDLLLPGQDGLATLREIRSAAAPVCDVPVVVISSAIDHERVVESRRLGVACVMTKPVHPSQLIEVVNSIESFHLTITIVSPPS